MVGGKLFQGLGYYRVTTSALFDILFSGCRWLYAGGCWRIIVRREGGTARTGEREEKREHFEKQHGMKAEGIECLFDVVRA